MCVTQGETPPPPPPPPFFRVCAAELRLFQGLES